MSATASSAVSSAPTLIIGRARTFSSPRRQAS